MEYFIHLRPQLYNRQLKVIQPYPNGGISFLVFSGNSPNYYRVLTGLFEVTEWFSQEDGEEALRRLMNLALSHPTVSEVYCDHEPTLDDIIAGIFDSNNLDLQQFVTSILAQNGHAKNKMSQDNQTYYDWVSP